MMRIGFIVLLASMLLSCTSKEGKQEDGMVTIKGTFDIEGVDAIQLSKIEYGQFVTVATKQLGSDHKFEFRISPQSEGFYVINPDQHSFTFEYIPLYVMSNQSFDIAISKSTYLQTNIPDQENEILYQWMQVIDTLSYYTMFNEADITYKDFFPFYKDFFTVIDAYHGQVTTENKKFNGLMHTYIDMIKSYTLTKFMTSGRSEYPTDEEMPDYIRAMMTNEVFQSEDLLDLPRGMDAIACFAAPTQLHDLSGVKRTAFKKWSVEIIPNQKLRAHYLIAHLDKFFQAVNTSYQEVVYPNRAFIMTDTYLSEQLKAFELKVGKYGRGVAGYEFKFKDINGETVSFSDFSGKYVYIDCWATWCAPCKAEIPALKQLEKDFHGKDIAFVSVSFDKPDDKGKWKTFVKENSLTGVQLMVDDAFKTEMALEYKIKSIPRFLLFDKEGKVIDSDAKRPSEDIKSELEVLLKMSRS